MGKFKNALNEIANKDFVSWGSYEFKNILGLLKLDSIVPILSPLIFI